MNSRIATGLAALLLAAAAQNTLAAGDDKDLDAAAKAYNTKVDDPDRQLICRKETSTGSRIPKKVCRTRGQMEKEAEEAERYLKGGRPSGTNY